MKNKILQIFFLLIAGTLAGFGQTVIISPTVQPAQGGYFTNGNLQLQYTIGEPINETFIAGGYAFSLGFEQPEMNLTINTAPGSAYCAGAQISIPFSAKGIYGTSNIFTAQLSDSSGSFTNAISVGFDTAVTSGTITATLPDSILAGSHFKIRVVSSYPVFTGGPSAFIKIGILPDSITPTQQDTIICPGGTSNINLPTSESGIRYVLMTNNTILSSIFGSDSMLTLNTGPIDSNMAYTIIATDTNTGCYRQLLPYIYIYTSKIGMPTSIVSRAVVSDTPYTFIFSNVTAGGGGNQVIWAFDSSFTVAHTDTSPTTISITVSPNSDTLIWIKSRDSISGCTSLVNNIIAIVTHQSIDTPHTYLIDTVVCSGTSASVQITNSKAGVLYKLQADTLLVSSALGNDSLLLLSTGNLDTTAVFKVIGKDTITGNTVYIDSNLIVIVAPNVSIPIFIRPDTIAYYNDTIGYLAIDSFPSHMIYSISYGNASVDSVTGYVSNIASDFMITATAIAPYGCSSASASVYVNETDLLTPAAPAKQWAYVDSNEAKTFTFSNIWGIKGNEIEWATNKDFTNSQIQASPATITLTVPAGTSTNIYLRSKDSKSGKVSKTAKSGAESIYPLICAGLLDKSQWQMNALLSDEFLYNRGVFALPSYQEVKNEHFFDKWNLTFAWGGNCTAGSLTDPDPTQCGNYTNYGNNNPASAEDESELYDFGNYPVINAAINPLGPQGTGTGGEVRLASGAVDLRATQINGGAGVTYSCTGSPTKTFQYRSGMLCSTKRYALSPSIFEIRAKQPSQPGAWPTAWVYSSTQLVFPDNLIGNTSELKTAFSDQTQPQEPDGSYPGCGASIWIDPSCDFSMDWHTYDVVSTPNELAWFVDGKEAWSSKVYQPTNNLNFPADLTCASPLFIDLQVTNWATFFSTDYVIDYFRYYQPKSSSNLQFFQNLHGTTSPWTYESPQPPGSTTDPFYNNQQVYISNNTINPYINTTHIIAPLSKMSVLNSNGNTYVFYLGANADKRCYYTTLPIGTTYSGQERCVIPFIWPPIFNSNPSAPLDAGDVQGFITPVNPGLIYFQSTGNQLNYFVGTYYEGSVLYYTESVACVNNNPAKIIQNCAGYITVDFLNRVWYKGTDNNLWVWNPGDGTLTQITNDGSVTGAVTLDPGCGCLAFYRDNNHNLRQLYWWNTWHVLSNPVVNNGNVSDNIICDWANGKVYFIGKNDNAVYSYTNQYSSSNSLSLFRLGNGAVLDNFNNFSQCNGYYNAASDLTLSNDGNYLYYKGTDGKLWYYFNDHEYSANGTSTISNANWNRTSISSASTIAGPIALEPGNTGRIFYAGADNTLYSINPIDADNSLSCNVNGSTLGGNYSTRALVVNDTAIAVDSGQAGITVYPNPSSSGFTINLLNTPAGAVFNVQIENLCGQQVWQQSGKIPDSGNTYQLTWDANNVGNGIYLYKIRIGENKLYSGKVVKI